MNRFIQLKTNFEIDPKGTEKIVIRQEEFYHALEYGIKQAFRPSRDNLDVYVANGIVPCGNQVQRILDDGCLLFDQTKTQVNHHWCNEPFAVAFNRINTNIRLFLKRYW